MAPIMYVLGFHQEFLLVTSVPQSFVCQLTTEFLNLA